MKSIYTRQIMAVGLGVLVACAALVGARAAETPCRIQQVEYTSGEILVTVAVPEGMRRVTLEAKTSVDGGAWIPKAVARLEGAAGQLLFRIDRSQPYEFFRVRADATEALPAALYSSTNTFGAELREGVDAVPGSPINTATPDRSEAAVGGDRQVVESDIWRLRGDTLFFFNQYRGLQVIDVGDAATPALAKSFPLAAVGEQMYVPTDTRVVLLGRETCGNNGALSNRVSIVNVELDPPQLAAQVDIPGYLQESRMVGDVLYIASQNYRVTPAPQGGEVWEWGSQITSVDLSNLDAPVVRDTFWLPGYGNVIQATDRFLFSATGGWNTASTIQIIDISSPNGRMRRLGQITASGRVPDKFKMNLDGDIFTVISQAVGSDGRWFTSLQTFSLENPIAPARLGQLSIAPGEQVFATRFDGKKCYVVTFLRIDPLWIVDLSDPVKPVILGELEVPGWSTYIEPLGDRLLTVGIDNTNGWRVAVSLFDVRNPAKPSLLDKVFIGENSSWSEANSDEKAFNVLAEDGLILLPFQGYSTNGYAQKTQLIDLGESTLTARGTIDHTLQPRRATLHNGHVLSLSGRELVSVDATDRANPELKSTLQLSWTTSRVFPKGDFLVEMDEVNYAGWGAAAEPLSLRVTRKDNRDHLASTLVLPNADPIIGATMRGSLIHIVQARSDAAPKEGDTTSNLFLTIVDATNLPALSIAGSFATKLDRQWFSDGIQFHWIDGALVLDLGGDGYYWGWGGGPIDILARPAGGAALADVAGIARPGLSWPGGYGGGGKLLLALDIANPASIRQLSVTKVPSAALPDGQSIGQTSTSHLADGRLYFSMERLSEAKPEEIEGKPALPWIWRRQVAQELQVVDFADPAAPALRSPAAIPSPLAGISHGGDLLYTKGPVYKADGTSDYQERFSASAYDGVNVALLDSLAITNWPNAQWIFPDGRVWTSTGQPDGRAVTLQILAVNNQGKFESTASSKSADILYEWFQAGDVLVGRGYQSVAAFDATQTGRFAPLGSSASDSCYWFDSHRVTGSQAEGLWIPLQDYGVRHIPLAIP